MRPTELRGVLRYVKDYKDRIIVLSLDGAVVSHSNFSNLLMDIAVMRSLNIKVAIVHGAASEMERIARGCDCKLSDLSGSGITDAKTLEIAQQASHKISQTILEGLASVDLNGAITNALEAHPLGIIKGVNHEFSGKVQSVDTGFLLSLIDNEIIPIIPCIIGNGNQELFRVNSDNICWNVASKLKAIKIVFLTDNPGFYLEGNLVRQISTADLESIVKKTSQEKTVSVSMRSKLQSCYLACTAGVSRAHLVNGTSDGDLLKEIFSTEGVGSLVFTNEFDDIRPAELNDVSEMLAMTQSAINNEEILSRSRNELINNLKDYYVLLSRDQIAGCVALHADHDSNVGELAFLFVHPNFENKGIGSRLVRFIEDLAKKSGLDLIIALSTQTYSFFVRKSGFSEGSIELLPDERKSTYLANGRKSKILFKRISS